MDIARNHTATHILQAALREVLGSHIEQAGSYVSKDRLRFDFTHFEAISKEDLARVEHIVNEKILASIPVKMEEMPMEEAKKLGAMALFGEKYGDVVRVVSVGDYSVEFCGGTHISNSSQIGSFKIISETGVAAGTRRIEALTGAGVLNYYEDVDYLLNNIFSTLRTNSKNIISKIEHVLEENKQLSSELESLKSKLSGGLVDEIIAKAEDVNGFKYVSAKVSGIDMNALRNMGDQIKEKSGEGVGNGVATSLLDGNINTFWHSQWQGGSINLPHELVVDVKEVVTFSHIGLTERQHAQYKDVKAGEFFVSSDKQTWTSVGKFKAEQVYENQIFPITPTKGRYFKIQITESNREQNSSLAEIYAYGIK